MNLLLRGSRGADVKTLQKNLNRLHFLCGTIDGIFGPRTENAVLRLQEAYPYMRLDGKVGNQTWAKVLGNGQLSQHFNIFGDSLYSSGNGNLILSSTLIIKLEKLRALLNAPIKVNSCYRDPAYNNKIGGAINSYHMKGYAADIHSRCTPLRLCRGAASIGFGGVIKYSWGAHVDIRANDYHDY